jgi:hypothetical protein
MPDTLYIPLAQYMAQVWPKDLLDPPPPDQISDVWLEPPRIKHTPSYQIRTALLFKQELALSVPGLNGVKIVLAPSGSNTTFMFELDSAPSPIMRVVNIPLSIRIASDLLKPARKVLGSNGQVERIEVDPTKQFVDITVAQATLSIDLEGNLGISTSAGPNLPLSLIGETGVALEANNIQLFGRYDTPPSGKSAGWRGIFIPSATLYLPGELAGTLGSLTISNAYIGNGGFSGNFSTSWSPAKTAILGGVGLSLDSVTLGFVQNALTAGTLAGRMTVPFFDQPLPVEISIAVDGSFQIKVAQSSGLATLSKPSILSFEVNSIAFRYQNQRVTTLLGGRLQPLYQHPAPLEWPAFDVRELAIDSEGNVQLEGGWLNLPQQYTLKLYGFQLEITKLGFGKTKDGGKWVGFSGTLKFVDGLTAGASAEGLRITWYDDGTFKLSLEGVGVLFEVPGAISFSGSVALKSAPDRFDGAVKLSLPALKLAFDGKIVIGSQNGQPYYALYIDAELPVGLPLANTGLAIYGIAGLFANQMAPARLDGEDWYTWYQRPTGTPAAPGVTDLFNKWAFKQDALGLGAGATLGTFADNGFAFASKLLFAIVFPGPVIMLEGRANILKQRTALNDSSNPAFRLYSVLDANVGDLLLALAAQYKFDDGGALLDISGGAEAYFNWNDPTLWHFYLGQNDPREKRIRAQFLSLFTAESYLMLSQRELAMGGRVGWGKSWRFGPLKVTLEGWIEGGAAINWQPAHFHGQLELHGSAGLRAYGIGVSLSIGTHLSADVFAPFHVAGRFTVEINLPWPLPDIRASVNVEWPPKRTAPTLPSVLKEIAIEHPLVATTWPLPRGQFLLPSTAPAPDINSVPLVPVDARPSITFNRPVHDAGITGVNAAQGGQTSISDNEFEYIGDPVSRSGPAKVRYSFELIALERKVGMIWQLVAQTPAAAGPTPPPELLSAWATVPPMSNPSGAAIDQVKLQVWAKTGFFYARSTGQGDDWFANNVGNYTCSPDPIDTEVCYDFNNVDPAVPPIGSWDSDDRMVHLGWCTPPTVVVKTISGASTTVLDFDSFPGPDFELIVMLNRPAKSIRFELDGTWTNTYKLVYYDEYGNPQGPFTLTPTGSGLTSFDFGSAPTNMTRIVILFHTLLPLRRVCVTYGLSSNQHIERIGVLVREQQLVDVWYKSGEVLQPYSFYRLRVKTAADLRFTDKGAGAPNPQIFDEYAYFRTGGPPGLAALSTPIGFHQPEFKSGLEDLRLYVDQTVPRSTGADSKPILPRPVYRAYDVGITFKASTTYLEQVYRMSRRNLGLYLFDQNNRPAHDTRGQLIVSTTGWGQADVLALTKDEDQWLTVLSSGGCLTIDRSRIPRNSKLADTAGHMLEAESYYEARLIPLLLHEDFASYTVGTSATGPSGALGTGLWAASDQTTTGGPSVWQVSGTAPSLRLTQTSAIGATDAASSGGLLLYGDDTALPASEQAGAWTNYRICLFLRAGVASGAVGVVFRYQSATNYYRYVLGATSLRVERVVGGTLTTLAQNASFSLQANLDYKVTVEVFGSSLSVFQAENGGEEKRVFKLTDSSLSSGRVGLYCWKSVGSTYQDIRIDDLRASAPLLHRFQFTTSQFSNFYHHIHSARTTVWTDDLTVTDISDADLTTLRNKGVTTSTSAITATEAAGYEQLATLVLGAAGAQRTVKGVEVTQLRRGSTLVGVLVQSPEPIAWARTTLSCLRSTTALLPPGVAGPAKLAEVTFSSTANNETVSLLLLEDLNLTGARIERRPLSPAGTVGGWVTHYTFGTEGTVRSGTRVIVYSGNATSAPVVLVKTVMQRFRSSTSAFPAAGVELRVVGTDGKVWHERQFLPASSYAAASTRVLRKQDGTGFAVFGASANVLAAGAYRLNWSFNRGASLDAANPPMSEAGNTSAETASLDLQSLPF